MLWSPTKIRNRKIVIRSSSTNRRLPRLRANPARSSKRPELHYSTVTMADAAEFWASCGLGQHDSIESEQLSSKLRDHLSSFYGGDDAKLLDLIPCMVHFLFTRNRPPIGERSTMRYSFREFAAFCGVFGPLQSCLFKVCARCTRRPKSHVYTGN